MQPMYAVELLKAPSESYAANFSCPVYNGPIEDFVAEIYAETVQVPHADLVIGGPPCQGFSLLGKMSAGSSRHASHESMNRLWNYFAEVVAFLNPPVFVTENVPGFLRSVEFDTFIDTMEGYGYKVAYGVLSADQFGVPQRRRRAFAIGSRVGEPSLPAPNGHRATVRDAIGHLPLTPTEENWHVGRNPTAVSLERYGVIPPGGNRFDLMRLRPDITPHCWLEKPTGTTDVFGRLHWDKPSSTIRTEFFKPEKGRYLHPSEDRPITHREAACLQTFPASFAFVGSKTEVARQIGEAVPPLLAAEVAKACIPLILSATTDSHMQE
jgi:DNA (cytosine-5)-methyltransferase 1